MSPRPSFSLSLFSVSPLFAKMPLSSSESGIFFFLSPSCFYVSISEIPITSVLLDCSGDFPFSLINLGGCDRWRPSFLFLRRRQSLSRATGLSPSLRDGKAKKTQKDGIPLIFPRRRRPQSTASAAYRRHGKLTRFNFPALKVTR